MTRLQATLIERITDLELGLKQIRENTSLGKVFVLTTTAIREARIDEVRRALTLTGMGDGDIAGAERASWEEQRSNP